MDKVEFLKNKRDYVIASILSFKDNHCDEYLPVEISASLREQVLDQINHLCNVALDLINDDVVYNELFMDKFNEMFTMVKEIYDE